MRALNIDTECVTLVLGNPVEPEMNTHIQVVQQAAGQSRRETEEEQKSKTRDTDNNQTDGQTVIRTNSRPDGRTLRLRDSQTVLSLQPGSTLM